MRCRNCGRVIDSCSRFCVYCDTDNYPHMNQVKTKGAGNMNGETTPKNSSSARQYYQKTSAANSSTYKPNTYTTNKNNAPQNNKNASATNKNAGQGCLIIFIILFILGVFGSFISEIVGGNLLP